MDLGLDGRVCVVTGASSGIGLATARRLSVEGAGVLLVARHADALDLAAASCGPGRVATLSLDMTGADVGERALEAARAELGEPWALVNNAGTMDVVALADLVDRDWNDQWDLNVMASMRMMRSFAPAMARGGGGRIVNVSSSSGKRSSGNNAAYSVAKTAQLALSRAYADGYAAEGVLVNALAPGMTDTPLWHAEGGLGDQVAAARGVPREQALSDARAKIPLGRFGTEDEIAAVATFLCSEDAAFVTGAVWSVDGGSVPTVI